jgi:Ni/Co efflux regulator RcnB
MKRTVVAAMVLSLMTGAAALADPPQADHHDRDQRQDQRQDQRHDEHHDRREERRPEMRGGEMHGHDFDSGRYRRPHGYYVRHWRRGDRLPPAWRDAAYVVPDWRYYRLRPPPPGYYWVRVNDNAVLAAIGTGIVLDIAYNVFR